jgi:ribosomal protein L19E
MHQVMIHPASYETVRAAIDRAFDLFPLDLKDKKVLIKPNVLRASDGRGRHRHPSGRAGRRGGQGGNHGDRLRLSWATIPAFSATAPMKRLSSRPV